MDISLKASPILNKIYIALLFVCTALSIFTAIHAEASEIKKKRTLKIGATLALTGRYAFIGEAERDGLLLAVEQINAARSSNQQPRIELIIEDNAGEPKTAVASVHKLIQVDKVDVIFSAFTHITQAIKDLVAKHKILLLYQSSTTEIAESNQFFFRDYLDIKADAVILARLVSKAKFKKVAYLRDEGDVCENHQQAFLHESSKLGLEIIGKDEFISGENDLRSLLLRTKRTNPEVFVFCAWRDAFTIMRQLKELGMINTPTFHTLAPFLPIADTFEARQLYAENKTISTWYGMTDSAQNSKQAAFLASFRKRFGKAPRPDSAFAYDDMIAINLAAEECAERFETSCLRDRLLSTDMEGAAGRLSFDKSGNSFRQGFAIQVKEGKWVRLSDS